MNKPWQHNVAGLPSNAELDRAKQAHQAKEEAERAQQEDERRKLVGDPEIYDHRLDERGFRQEREFWRMENGHWKKYTDISKRQTASAAVNEGSIKALTTKAVPANLSRSGRAWLAKIDKNTAIDQVRQIRALEKKHGLLAEEAQTHERNSLPAKPKRVPPQDTAAEP